MNNELVVDIINFLTQSKIKIKHIKSKNLNQGFNLIPWDGRNEFGRILANGVYIYKIIAKNNNHKISVTL